MWINLLGTVKEEPFGGKLFVPTLGKEGHLKRRGRLIPWINWWNLEGSKVGKGGLLEGVAFN